MPILTANGGRGTTLDQGHQLRRSGQRRAAMDIQQSGSQLSGVSGPGVMFEPDVRAARNTASTSKRDPRIDVLRGLALLMIFVDHVPDNLLSLITLRNFGFSDAAEVFVLLAGFSSMLAYGRIF